MRRVLLLATLTALLGAGTAHAGWRIDRATAIAAKVWNNPCSGNVRITWEPLDGLVAGAWDDCHIAISTHDPWAWEPLCTTLIHEYGHLAGYRDPRNVGDEWHSSNPDSVMAAMTSFAHGVGIQNGRAVEDWSGTDRRCRDRGRPYLGLKTRRHTHR